MHGAALGLSDAELKQYETDGFLIRPQVFNEAEVAAFQQAATEACDKAVAMAPGGKTYFLDNKRFVDCGHLTIQFEHQPGSHLVRVIEPVHELSQCFDNLIDHERIVAPMQAIIGQHDLALWTAKLNMKSPEQGSGFGWHQDSPYWVHDSDHVDLLPNVLVTFDDCRLDNGCLQVIRGSHRQGCLPGTADGTQLGGFFTDPKCFDEKDAVPMIAPAGSLVFLSPHTVHGSKPNFSPDARRAIIITYQPANFPALKSKQVRNIHHKS